MSITIAYEKKNNDKINTKKIKGMFGMLWGALK
jgi:hypothetical protein